MLALSEDINTTKVKLDHFLRAKLKIKGRLTKEVIEMYERFAQKGI
jgi:SpoVK/Ycf46/Vps4 family AAA+-type ATPase